ncbi:NAD(P)/FAD-dependent oxidoreductase, partial [Actinoplanes sp. NPDC048791]|uniref:NAD(P)/FAD-dependent oxidoreductase n=1 Tax=Actinoplanes sp. NPDC048791 TaxID=3154623 RepID=UPI0033C67B8E
MTRPHIVIIGAGFAGYHAARRLSRLARGNADITLINPTDYFLYLPLLPEVAGGILDPRHVTISLAETLPGIRHVPGEATAVEPDQRRVHYHDPEGRRASLGYDRLLVTVGSVNKLLPIPGVADNAHGFRGLPEALYLRDHLIRQVELAACSSDPVERAARLTFVVVGAGYTGTEVTAQGQLLTAQLAERYPHLIEKPRWMLIDHGDRILAHLDHRLSEAATGVLTRRGIDVRTGTSVSAVTSDGVRLGDEFVAGRTLVWSVGVRPDPLVTDTGLRLEQGRIAVDAYLRVPGHPRIYACGDAAAVPDLTRPGKLTAMTAQHAQRQGVRAAGNIAADYGIGQRRPYRHASLGFAVDLGGTAATAKPLGLPLRGL